MKKGFTLVEMIAVVVIIALISIIMLPLVINQVNNSKGKLDKTLERVINESALNYIEEDGDVTANYGSVNCVKISSLIDYGYLDEPLINPSTKEEVDKNLFVKVTSTDPTNHSFELTDTCEVVVGLNEFIKTNNDGANVPALNNGLVAVTIDKKGNVKKADISNNNWYNYDDKKWANAVVLADKNGDVTKDNILAYYVWIPRYEYKTGFLPGEGNEESIEINFIGKDVTTPSAEHIIPPGFTFGDTNLSGIWVAKYKPHYSNSSGPFLFDTCDTENCTAADKIRILPGVEAIDMTSVSKGFYASRSLENSYDLVGNSHSMKNSEWSTVAYLSHSKYGKNSEVSYSSAKTTGGGPGDAYVSNTSQSTSGNITGIYDMAGGQWETMMSTYGADENTGNIEQSGFSELPDRKYYDIMYNANTMLGHSMSEVENWYNDYNAFVTFYSPWVVRGGVANVNGGLFCFNTTSGGGYYSFRPVLTPND